MINRRDFIKRIGVGVGVASTTTLLNIDKNPMPCFQEHILSFGGCGVKGGGNLTVPTAKCYNKYHAKHERSMHDSSQP